MLNDYHIQFLSHLLRRKVTFLVIGGQARWLLDASHRTSDLDVWVRLVPEDVPTLERSIIAWGREHPQHSNRNLVLPLGLRSGMQLAFPENDGVWFINRSGQPKEIGIKERVDILTSLGDLNFGDCLKRAVAHRVADMIVMGLSPEDLDAAERLRTKSEAG